MEKASNRSDFGTEGNEGNEGPNDFAAPSDGLLGFGIWFPGSQSAQFREISGQKLRRLRLAARA
jgi:hypothetical protein